MQVWRGFLRETDEAEIVWLLNTAAVAQALEAGLGQIQTSIGMKQDLETPGGLPAWAPRMGEPPLLFRGSGGWLLGKSDYSPGSGSI